jgi:transposase-like protein
MPSISVLRIRCPNPGCTGHRHPGKSSITRYGFFKLRNGSRRRRYRCVACGRTFSSTKGTPYYRIPPIERPGNYRMRVTTGPLCPPWTGTPKPGLRLDL